MGKLDSNFLFAIFQKTIHGTLIHGQISTKYANLGLFRHPCPTLVIKGHNSHNFLGDFQLSAEYEFFKFTWRFESIKNLRNVSLQVLTSTYVVLLDIKDSSRKKLTKILASTLQLHETESRDRELFVNYEQCCLFIKYLGSVKMIQDGGKNKGLF